MAMLFFIEIFHRVAEEILSLLSVDVLEESFIVAFGVTHLAEYLSIRTDDSLDGIA